MSSLFKVPLTTIKEINPHPGADRLELATVYGFQVIVQKGTYQVGDKAFYIPVDSILSEMMESLLFPPDSKVKLTKSRVRQIKLRGVASQGMLVRPNQLPPGIAAGMDELEQDYAPALGITKFEPPVKVDTSIPSSKKVRLKENPNFYKYGGLDNVKWFPDKFKADEKIVLQEKIHGTNARAALMPYVANTWLKKLKKWLGIAPKFEFCYGSNNVQLQNRIIHNGYYGEDIYGKVFKSIDVQSKLKPGETIYGEIYGDGIQKNYTYGCGPGIHNFVLFDVRILQPDGSHKWLSPDEVGAFAKERGLVLVPELYRGNFISLDFVKGFTKGSSKLAPSQKIREGVVIKSLDNYNENGQNRALKVISEDYLADTTNTDFN